MLLSAVVTQVTVNILPTLIFSSPDAAICVDESIKQVEREMIQIR